MKRRISLLLILAIGVGTLALVFSAGPEEPLYDGKRLGKWMDDVYPRASKSAAAFRAVLEIGTNALPTILKRFRARDSVFKERLMELEGKQSIVRVPFQSAATLHEQAMTALVILGPRAKPAIPELLNLLVREDTSNCAARALLGIEPTLVTALIKALGSERTRVRLAIAYTLGQKEYQSDVIVSALLRCITDKDPDVSAMAWAGLSQKAPDLVIPKIIELLNDSNTEDRTTAVWTLGTFGRDARAAVATLLKLRNDGDPEISEAARIALRRIEPRRWSDNSPGTPKPQ